MAGQSNESPNNEKRQVAAADQSIEQGQGRISDRRGGNRNQGRSRESVKNCKETAKTGQEEVKTRNSVRIPNPAKCTDEQLNTFAKRDLDTLEKEWKRRHELQQKGEAEEGGQNLSDYFTNTSALTKLALKMANEHSLIPEIKKIEKPKTISGEYEKRLKREASFVKDKPKPVVPSRSRTVAKTVSASPSGTKASNNKTGGGGLSNIRKEMASSSRQNKIDEKLKKCDNEKLPPSEEGHSEHLELFEEHKRLAQELNKWRHCEKSHIDDETIQEQHSPPLSEEAIELVIAFTKRYLRTLEDEWSIRREVWEDGRNCSLDKEGFEGAPYVYETFQEYAASGTVELQVPFELPPVISIPAPAKPKAEEMDARNEDGEANVQIADTE